MSTKLIFLAIIITLSYSGLCRAENENDYFSKENSIITENTLSKESTAPAEEKKTIALSGEFTSAAINSILTSSSTSNSLYTFSVCNLFLDARLKKMMKVFANMEIDNISQTNTTTTFWRELFFDFNYENKAYFRTGKQVLQWGRCNLWNPTDFINIEKKPFIRKIGYREGTYGLKAHVPFGTKYNFYGFIDTEGAAKSEDASLALKFEFMAGNTEMAFSSWLKNNKSPAYGYDFSSRLFHIDLLGEISVSKDDIQDRLIEESGVISTTRNTNDWAPQASFDMTKFFDLGNFTKRISVTNEFFYNGRGYNDNIFGDNRTYTFAKPIVTVTPLGLVTETTGTKARFFTANNLYSQNYYSKYYDAVFVSVGRFIVTDMTLNLNYIKNLCDTSGVLSTGVTYTNLNDFTLGLLVDSVLGSPNEEYTLPNEKFDVQLTLGITF
jgi:hypothetical protein